MSTYIADSLRDIAANPTPDAIGDLQRLANMVERLEICMDDVVGDAALAELRKWQPKRIPAFTQKV